MGNILSFHTYRKKSHRFNPFHSMGKKKNKPIVSVLPEQTSAQLEVKIITLSTSLYKVFIPIHRQHEQVLNEVPQSCK